MSANDFVRYIYNCIRKRKYGFTQNDQTRTSKTKLNENVGLIYLTNILNI